MRTRSAIALFSVAAVVAALAPAAARAGAWMPAPGEQFTEIRGSRLSSDDFHNADGDRVILPFGGLYERRDATWSAELGWKKSTSVFFSLPWSSASRRLADPLGAFPSETGFGDLNLGLRRKLAGGGASVVSLEASWNAPLGYSRLKPFSDSELALVDTIFYAGASESDSVNVSRFGGRPALGEGEQSVQGVLWYGASLPGVRGFLEAGGGYRYYFEHMGDQLLMRANLGLWLGSSLLVAGRYEGEMAIGDGVTLAHELDRHLAGPMILYRVDDFVDVYVGSLHSAIASNALHSDQFYAGVAFRNTKLNRLQGFLGGKKNP